MYQGTPYAVEPDARARMVFIASMTHARMQKPMLSEKPDVTCPDDVANNERRKEVAHREEVPREAKPKKTSGDKKTTFTIKAKSILVTLWARRLGQSARSGDCVFIKRLRTSWSIWRSPMQTRPLSSSSSQWGNARCSLCSNRSCRFSRLKISRTSSTSTKVD